MNLPVVNLYGEPDGIAIYLNSYHDIARVPTDNKWPDAGMRPCIKVIGHSLYCCSADEAEQRIRAAYLHATQYP